MLKRIRSTAGAALRWLSNLVTGNSFKRIELRQDQLMAELRRARQAAVESRDLTRRLHDAQQEALLAMYQSKNRPHDVF